MMLRRLFALGAAPLSHVAWCAPGDFIPAPPFNARPGFLFRDGSDGKGYYRVANSPEAPFPPEPSLAPKKQKVREGVDSERCGDDGHRLARLPCHAHASTAAAARAVRRRVRILCGGAAAVARGAVARVEELQLPEQ